MYIGSIIFSLVCSPLQSQTLSSPLSAGRWVKFSVSANGIYKIDYHLLQSAGIDPNTINPTHLQLYSNGTGMLPQLNSTPRINKLQEIAITVVGESDEMFDTTDYLLFYGQGPDKQQYDTANNLVNYENHLYSDKNFYFLTLGNQLGKRMVNKENVSGTYPIIDTYNDFIYHELEEYNRLNSGRQWLGERFDPESSVTLSFDLPGAVATSSNKIISSVVAESSSTSLFQVSLNGSLIENQVIDPTIFSRFGIKGRQKIDTLSVSSSAINTARAQQQLTYRFVPEKAVNSVGYLDFLLMTIQRKLAFYGSQTPFRSLASLAYPTSTFRIGAFPEDGIIWEVTDPFLCVNQVYKKEDNSAIFSTETTHLKKFIAARPNTFSIPQIEGEVTNQNLYALPQVDLLIVAHPLFQKEAHRLADHRRFHDHLNVVVVTPEEIYNDYSGGKQDPTAIRDLAKDLFSKGLKNILLFGRSSYDFKDQLNQNTNFIPTYASRSSLDPLTTYSSDDYFTFFDLQEGTWAESDMTIQHTLDIGVGRLPVKTLEEAKIVVNKLIAYDLDPQRMGVWRTKMIFVADDGDRNLHQKDADIIADDITTHQPEFNTQKIYLDAFTQISRPSGQTSPDARNALKKALKKGALILNFTGHGSEEIWLQERILDESFINEWENDQAYPFLVTATCEFGRHDNPYQISSGEKTLTKEDGGSIGLITATRPVFSSSNSLLNRAFYNALFKKEGGLYRDIGAIFKETKNNSMSPNSASNRNFSLLGDPSMHLAIPENEIKINSIKTDKGSDTLRALSKVIVKGEIWSKEIKDTSFSGTLKATLRDKEFSLSTLEDPVDENIAFNYKVRSNILFQGTASIVDGEFQFTFIMPKNTVQNVENGKLSLYAIKDQIQSDASGGTINLKVGKVEENVESDEIPPNIRLFIGDTTFVNGGIVDSDINIIAMLSDQHGISAASYKEENSPKAVLDGSTILEVGEYYFAAKDDFTKGSIIFPLEGLLPGDHTLELRVWDVYNNFFSSTISFRVTQDNSFFIHQLYNYPNPFSQSTQIQFTHSRSGDDLLAYVIIVDLAGHSVNTSKYSVPKSPYRVVLPEWNRSNTDNVKLEGGVYILRLIVRSLSDGTRAEKSTRLIMLD